MKLLIEKCNVFLKVKNIIIYNENEIKELFTYRGLYQKNDVPIHAWIT